MLATARNDAGSPTRQRPPAPARLRIGLALASVSLAAGMLGSAGTAAAAPASVPCTGAGSGVGGSHYNCNFYPSDGAPVQRADGQKVGTLHPGTNWVICQRTGGEARSGAYYNNNWAWTLSDQNTWGWVNAVYASGGDNNGPFGGVPQCGTAHGQPPGAAATQPPVEPPVTPPVTPPDPGPGEPTAPPPRPTSCASTPAAGDNVTRWNPMIVCILGMLGQPAGTDIVHAVDVLIEHESSGNPNAVNLWDSNAQAGHPSKGLTQTIQSTFDGNRSPALANNIYDPAANVYAGLHYGINRYGSIRDIPGIRNVLRGESYVGYAAAQTKGLARADSCGRSKVGRLVLTIDAQHVSCHTARLAVRPLDRTPIVRRATGLVQSVRIRAAKRTWVCDVDGTNRHGATRAVFCQSGTRTLWWSARGR